MAPRMGDRCSHSAGLGRLLQSQENTVLLQGEDILTRRPHLPDQPQSPRQSIRETSAILCCAAPSGILTACGQEEWGETSAPCCGWQQGGPPAHPLPMVSGLGPRCARRCQGAQESGERGKRCAHSQIDPKPQDGEECQQARAGPEQGSLRCPPSLGLSQVLTPEPACPPRPSPHLLLVLGIVLQPIHLQEFLGYPNARQVCEDAEVTGHPEACKGRGG